MLPLAVIASLASPTELHFAAQVDPWQATCAPLTAGAPADCDPPTAAATPGTSTLDLTLPAAAGQASQTQAEFSLGAYAGVISLYGVYPQPETGYPQYIQVKIDLTSPVRATCAESVRLRDPMELPPVICAGFTGAKQQGVTITFK